MSFEQQSPTPTELTKALLAIDKSIENDISPLTNLNKIATLHNALQFLTITILNGIEYGQVNPSHIEISCILAELLNKQLLALLPPKERRKNLILEAPTKLEVRKNITNLIIYLRVNQAIITRLNDQLENSLEIDNHIKTIIDMKNAIDEAAQVDEDTKGTGFFASFFSTPTANEKPEILTDTVIPTEILDKAKALLDKITDEEVYQIKSDIQDTTSDGYPEMARQLDIIIHQIKLTTYRENLVASQRPVFDKLLTELAKFYNDDCDIQKQTQLASQTLTNNLVNFNHFLKSFDPRKGYKSALNLVEDIATSLAELIIYQPFKEIDETTQRLESHLSSIKRQDLQADRIHELHQFIYDHYELETESALNDLEKIDALIAESKVLLSEIKSKPVSTIDLLHQNEDVPSPLLNFKETINAENETLEEKQPVDENDATRNYLNTTYMALFSYTCLFEVTLAMLKQTEATNIAIYIQENKISAKNILIKIGGMLKSITQPIQNEVAEFSTNQQQTIIKWLTYIESGLKSLRSNKTIELETKEKTQTDASYQQKRVDEAKKILQSYQPNPNSAGQYAENLHRPDGKEDKQPKPPRAEKKVSQEKLPHSAFMKPITRVVAAEKTMQTKPTLPRVKRNTTFFDTHNVQTTVVIPEKNQQQAPLCMVPKIEALKANQAMVIASTENQVLELQDGQQFTPQLQRTETLPQVLPISDNQWAQVLELENGSDNESSESENESTTNMDRNTSISFD